MHKFVRHFYIYLSLYLSRWFFSKLDGKQAESLLMTDWNQYGSYIVRDGPNGYTLSIRDTKKVKHYRIKRLNVEDGFYITRQITFKSIMDLVIHYRQQAGVLCVNLRYPYVSSVQPLAASRTKRDDIKWEIDHKQIQLKKKIVSDPFSDIWEGLLNGKISVAVKSLKPGSKTSSAEFLREAELMKQLQNPHLLRLHAVCTKEPIYLVTELMKHGSLQRFLRNEGKSLNYSKLMDMASQIAAGMICLEELNYVHRDLCVRNVFVGDQLVCKVAGFHSAQALEGGFYQAPAGSQFPIKWTAPEAAWRSRFTIKSDVWSFGIVLYEIITYGQSPYPGMTNGQVLKKVLEGYRMPQHATCPDELYEIMISCWGQNPTGRPSFKMLHKQLCGLAFEDDSDLSLSFSSMHTTP